MTGAADMVAPKGARQGEPKGARQSEPKGARQGEPKGARQGEPKGARQSEPKGDTKGDTAGELARLFPDVPVAVRDPDTGETVALTVREFRFREGLEATAAARPIILALAALVPDGDEPAAEAPDALAFDAVIAAHADRWLELIGRACGREPAWLARLGDHDARRLSVSMWTANGPFFMRRLVEAIAEGSTAASLFRSIASSTRSSAPATGADTTT